MKINPPPKKKLEKEYFNYWQSAATGYFTQVMQAQQCGREPDQEYELDLTSQYI